MHEDAHLQCVEGRRPAQNIRVEAPSGVMFVAGNGCVVVQETGQRFQVGAEGAHAVHLGEPGDVELGWTPRRELEVDESYGTEPIVVADHVGRTGVAPQHSVDSYVAWDDGADGYERVVDDG